MPKTSQTVGGRGRRSPTKVKTPPRAGAPPRAPDAPKKTASQAARWCFTVPAKDLEHLRELGARVPAFAKAVGAVALIAGPERAPSGLFHLQGAAILAANKRLAALKKLAVEYLGVDCHWSVMRGTRAENKKYCTKAETRVEGMATIFVGDEAAWDVEERERTDIGLAVERVAKLGWEEACRQHPEMIGTLTRNMEAIKAAAAAIRVPELPPIALQLQYWQAHLWNVLQGKPDSRKIIFVYDEQGNAGKSYMSAQLCAYAGAVVLNGTYPAMAYQFCHMAVKPRIVIFDVTRGQSEWTAGMISFAESLKNGVLTSSRYQGVTATFAPPHVVFFTNDFLTGSERLSTDRYDVWALAPLSPVLDAKLPDYAKPKQFFPEAFAGKLLQAPDSWLKLAKKPMERAPVEIFWDRHAEAPSDVEDDLPDAVELANPPPPPAEDRDSDVEEIELSADRNPDMAPPWGFWADVHDSEFEDF